jgi:hypothetical protein
MESSRARGQFYFTFLQENAMRKKLKFGSKISHKNSYLVTTYSDFPLSSDATQSTKLGKRK